MFVDQVHIEVAAGRGGHGAATFRKEKYVAFGGPDGGDGGRGGSVVAQVDGHLSTLLDFRFKHTYQAEHGGDGRRKNMFGKHGAELVLRVPAGTAIYDDDTGELVADVVQPGVKYTLATGGIGGRGNSHFATSTHQTPKFAERGEPGQARKLRLDLKLLADVGLLGFPSTGKSTLISSVSAARPKIADYPFTTLVPNLGVVAVEGHPAFVMADLPGLIEGAHEGVGLGHRFLRHVERTRLLIHVLDVGGLSGREPLEDFEIINRELEKYNPETARLPQIVALNKVDLVLDPLDLDPIESNLVARGYEVFRISAATRQGLDPLLFRIVQRLAEMPVAEPPSPDEATVKVTRKPDDRRWEIVLESPGEWAVVGKGMERMANMTNLDNEQGVRRLQRSLEKLGVYEKLADAGAKKGDNVRIGMAEFDYVPDE